MKVLTQPPITVIIKKIQPNIIISLVKVSKDNTSWEDYVLPSSKNSRFVLFAENINIEVE